MRTPVMRAAVSQPTVAVVTGAARGVGRGIALVLGEAGAMVYVTDLQTRSNRHAELPGTAEDTAEQVTERGGHGIPVDLDHTDDDAVATLFAYIRDEHGGLDLLVANAFNGNALPFTGGPFWTLPLEHWRNMVDAGVRGHLVAAWHAAPLLIERRGLAVLTGYTDPERKTRVSLFFDKKTGLLSRATYFYTTIIGNIAQVNDYSNYQRVNGVQVPMKIEIHSAEKDQVLQYKSARVISKPDPGLFDPRKP